MELPEIAYLEEKDGLVLCEFTQHDGERWFVVGDEEMDHYRLNFHSTEDGYVSVGVDAELSDVYPGELANFTHKIDAYCGPNDTLSISDDGLLTVFTRKRAATGVDFRHGFTLQLTEAFVPLVRRAITLARARALFATGAASLEGVVDKYPDAHQIDLPLRM